MAYKLAAVNYTSGLEPQAAMAWCALNAFDTITPPVTEAAMRSLLETGQLQPYSDAGWDAFLNIVGNLSLDTSVLTAGQISIMNTLYAAITPAPQLACCGSDAPTAVPSGDTSPYAQPRTGSLTFEHEIGVKLLPNITCNIKSILVTITGAVMPTTPQPFTMRFKECDVNENSIFTKIWVQFGADPSGTTYDVDYDFLDADGISITTFTNLAQLTL